MGEDMNGKEQGKFHLHRMANKLKYMQVLRGLLFWLTMYVCLLQFIFLIQHTYTFPIITLSNSPLSPDLEKGCRHQRILGRLCLCLHERYIRESKHWYHLHRLAHLPWDLPHQTYRKLLASLLLKLPNKYKQFHLAMSLDYFFALTRIAHHTSVIYGCDVMNVCDI